MSTILLDSASGLSPAPWWAEFGFYGVVLVALVYSGITIGKYLIRQVVETVRRQIETLMQYIEDLNQRAEEDHQARMEQIRAMNNQTATLADAQSETTKEVKKMREELSEHLKRSA